MTRLIRLFPVRHYLDMVKIFFIEIFKDFGNFLLFKCGLLFLCLDYICSCNLLCNPSAYHEFGIV